MNLIEFDAVEPVCPTEIFRQSVEWVRERGGVLTMCRGEGRCFKFGHQCVSCFVIGPGDQRPWYVLYQNYLRGDA